MNSLVAVAVVLATLSADQQTTPPALPQPRPQTFGDRAAVEITTRAYVEAWLANDPERVMATLLPDATIMPSGLPAIHGAPAIRRFWFPSTGAVTRVMQST